MLSTEVKFSKLIDRIDANFYTTQIKTVEELETSRVSEKSSMGELCTFPRTKTPGRYDYTQKGIPVIKLKNITDYFIDLNDTSFIPEHLYSNYIQPKEGDILITATGEGTIGRIGIFKNNIKCIVTAEVMIVRVKKDKINPYFLFSYLRSKYGKPLIIRFVRGSTGQTHLYSKDVKFISVPILPKTFQEKIEKLVKEAHEKYTIANQKYEQAKQLLEKELRLDKLKLKEEKIFEAKFSDLNTDKRFDVEFHKPMYAKIKELLEKGEKEKIFVVKKLKEVGKVSKGIEVGSDAYASEGYLFLRVSNLSEKEITIGPSSEFIRPLLYEQLKEKYKPQIGEVLYTKDATIGVSLVVEKNFNEFIPSGGIVRIKTKEVDPYYLALVLNSVICRSQSERRSIGAVIKHFNFKNVKNLKVPIVPKSKQEKISKLVKESFSLRKESKELLDKAKQEVEKLVGGK